MKDDLFKKKCIPCEGGVIPFDISEIHKYQKKVDGWNITKDKNEIFFLIKNLPLKIFWKAKSLLILLGKFQKMRGIIQTYCLVGVMPK